MCAKSDFLWDRYIPVIDRCLPSLLLLAISTPKEEHESSLSVLQAYM